MQDPGELWEHWNFLKTLEKLLNSNPAQLYPSGTDNLPESFADFFTNKIVRIRNDLDTFSRIPN